MRAPRAAEGPALGGKSSRVETWTRMVRQCFRSFLVPLANLSWKRTRVFVDDNFYIAPNIQSFLNLSYIFRTLPDMLRRSFILRGMVYLPTWKCVRKVHVSMAWGRWEFMLPHFVQEQQRIVELHIHRSGVHVRKFATNVFLNTSSSIFLLDELVSQHVSVIDIIRLTSVYIGGPCGIAPQWRIDSWAWQGRPAEQQKAKGKHFLRSVRVHISPWYFP